MLRISEIGKKPKRHVGIVFCLPGHPANREIEMLNAETVIRLAEKQITSVRFSWAMPNVYSCRNSHLSHSKRAGQRPFEDINLDYDFMIWQDSDNAVSYKHIFSLLRHQAEIVFGWCNMVPDATGKSLVSCGFVDPSGLHRAMPEDELMALPRDDRGLVEVDWSGFPLACIKKGVFEAGIPLVSGRTMEMEAGRNRNGGQLGRRCGLVLEDQGEGI